MQVTKEGACVVGRSRDDGGQRAHERRIFDCGPRVRPPGNEAARIASMYAAARSIPLAIVILALIGARATRPLTALAIVMALVQVLDVGVGLAQHDAAKTMGPAVLAILTFVAVRTLLRTSSE